MNVFEGALEALRPQQRDDAGVDYTLGIGGRAVALTDLLGREVAMTALGGILCVGCGAASATSHGGGYCRACFLRLPECDRCFRSPERCHHHLGTCRDPAWGTQVCMAEHLVYLAETSGAKVGITRPGRMPRRWLDQGALQAWPWLRVASRRIAGEVEAILRAAMSDRTNWRQMLRAEVPRVDLEALAATTLATHAPALQALRERFGTDAWQPFDGAVRWHGHYPLPAGGAPSLAALRAGAAGERVAGRVLGAKARYLVLDTGVFNTGSHAGVLLRLELDVRRGGATQGDLF